MKDISIAFPGVKALDNVSFRLFPGEVHTLMGENGAGKSTLIKALTGVYEIDSGSVMVLGEERHVPRHRRRAARGDRDGLPGSQPLHEPQHRREPHARPRGPRCRSASTGARPMRPPTRSLRAMGLGHLDSREPLASISIAMQQLVAISRAMVIDAKVLILDEPTSSLDSVEVENLFTVLRGLRDKGVAILFVSHFLDQVYAISDRITVLRNGAYVGEYLTRELERPKLISLMIGKDLATFASIGRAAASLESAESTEVLLEATGLGRQREGRAHRPHRPPGRGAGLRRPPRVRPHRARPPAVRRRQARQRRRDASTARRCRCTPPCRG